MNADDGSAYLEYAQAAPEMRGDALAQLTHLASEQARIAADILKDEEALSKKRDALRDIAEKQIPELMDSLNLTEFKTATGLKLKVEETIRASIPAALAARAFAWLKTHGHAALIKRDLKVSFGRGEDEKADALARSLAEQGFDADDKAGVHPSTLSAFVREKLRDGEEVPLDLFGVHRQRVSKIVN